MTMNHTQELIDEFEGRVNDCQEHDPEVGIFANTDMADDFEHLIDYLESGLDFNALFTALTRLVQLKAYKDEHGKDKYYYKTRDTYWQEAIKSLDV